MSTPIRTAQTSISNSLTPIPTLMLTPMSIHTGTSSTVIPTPTTILIPTLTLTPATLMMGTTLSTTPIRFASD